MDRNGTTLFYLEWTAGTSCYIQRLLQKKRIVTETKFEHYLNYHQCFEYPFGKHASCKGKGGREINYLI
jgi:hypothetical protein